MSESTDDARVDGPDSGPDIDARPERSAEPAGDATGEDGSPSDPEFDPEFDPDDPFGIGDGLGLDIGPLTEPKAAAEQLAAVTKERDEYLDLARRVQADFENYRRRVDAQRVEQAQRAAESLVAELLPVLDACDAAAAQGAEDVEPIAASLFGTLAKLGLERIEAVDAVFDPNQHEAVMQEPAGDGDTGTTVMEILRAGYQWNGRVVRPAMVKVRG